MLTHDSTAQQTRRQHLRRMLWARHIAFIGGDTLIPAIKICRELGFVGTISVVNPNRAEIAGLPCYPSVEALEHVPDAAFVAVRSTQCVAIVRALAARGTAGCVCYAAGFAEAGHPQLQAELVDAAADMALIGPNCYGFINYLNGVSLWPDRHGGHRVEHGAALISQSGNITLNLTMPPRSLPLAYAISVGNQAMLGIEDYIDVLADDPRVSAIGLYIEGIKDISAFCRAIARAQANGIPIVALKAGRSALGAQVTLSHTSSLAGADRLYDALFERLGIARADSQPELLEILKCMTIASPIHGRALGVLTCSGGDSALAADFAHATQVTLPHLPESIAAELKLLLPAHASVGNPLDYNIGLWGDRLALEHCISTFMRKRTFDAVMLVLDYPRQDGSDSSAWDAAVDAMIDVRRKTDIPMMVASNFPEGLPVNVRERLCAAGIAPLQGLDTAIRAVSATYLARSIRAEPVSAPSLSEGTPIVLDEWESKQYLHDAGIPSPGGALYELHEALTALPDLSYPVVVKAVDRQFSHKTECGLVQVNLQTQEAAEQALRDIAFAGSRQLGYTPRLLIEPMIRGAVAELIVGVSRDPVFGPVLIVGAGGVLVNLFDDSRPLLLPTDADKVESALRALRCFPLLDGYRGGPKGDIQAVVDAVLTVASFAQQFADCLLELDINPLFVMPEGRGVVMADALIRMQVETSNP
ncbi:acetate--CoA ligase family protein [Dyella tabacisoli]|uniref:CoA-binding protein n=1 Tax=Dyella tabacisoli TaxID=2282381 RepID=A0A369UPC7_9GAMM|nr:acetate--CoA ligase family protein [Dyella tabacisoli]RDD82327.1 CoA-binding protein [Dyella tabacisoli]